MPPFGYPRGFGSFGQPSFGGLGYEDLYRPTPQPKYPHEPNWIDTADELSEEDRRRLLRQQILRAAMVFGAPSGQWGLGLASVAGEGDEARQLAIQQARTRQEEQYESARHHAEEHFQSEQIRFGNEQRSGQVRAMLALRDRIISEDPSLRDRAEAALSTQDTAELQKLLFSIPGRQRSRALGLDPDDEFADETRRAQIQTEAEEERKRRELELLPQELGIRTEADLAEEARKKAAGFGTYYQSPSELMNAQAGRAPKTVELNDGLYQVGPDIDPLTGKLRLTLLKKQEKSPSGLQLVKEPVGYGQKPRYKVFDPATGQMRPLKDKDAWYNLILEERDKQVPAAAPLRSVPAPSPKGRTAAAPRPTQVTAPQQAPAGRGGGLRSQPPGKLRPLAAPSQAPDQSLVADTRKTIADEGEDTARQLLRQLGKNPNEIERILAAARGGQ